ncbi:hypothetical protein PBAL39_11130 [Pedobacter sp. BAL39]|uniref:DUF305 domain-containing protein n=1 Tax=Pedobacter sp. BAL39 TaxID=391596 RepID=UPI000155A6C1|nr:DUF305 domain-containing protein [Pedobacter sp. BAL39]EDM34546.1 hypothetical protein PBAL39_11130 [Pedobacter sp. BAL39]
MKNENQNNEHEKMNQGDNPYKKFLLMLSISFILMYGIMFLNVDQANHIYLSVTRTYMSILMISSMALVMLPMMGKMYPNKRLNKAILASAIIVFITALTFLRQQIFVGDIQYMKGMIPHHSSAIMTSKNANIKDPELKKLSEQIIKSQEEEIVQMKAKLKELEK